MTDEDAADLVFMGTSVVEGTATAVAFATGADTQFGQIYQMTAQVAEVASPLQRNVNRMARQVPGWSTASCSPWASWWRWCPRACPPPCRCPWP